MDLSKQSSPARQRHIFAKMLICSKWTADFVNNSARWRQWQHKQLKKLSGNFTPWVSINKLSGYFISSAISCSRQPVSRAYRQAACLLDVLCLELLLLYFCSQSAYPETIRLQTITPPHQQRRFVSKTRSQATTRAYLALLQLIALFN